MTTERNCLKCKHLHVDTGYPSNSDTPGEPARIECCKVHWDTDKALTNAKSMAKCLETAKQCPDYEETPP